MRLYVLVNLHNIYHLKMLAHNTTMDIKGPSYHVQVPHARMHDETPKTAVISPPRTFSQQEDDIILIE